MFLMSVVKVVLSRPLTVTAQSSDSPSPVCLLTPLAGRALPASQVSHHLFGRCKGKAIFQALQVFRQYSARFFSQNCPQTPVYKGFATSPLTTPLNNK